MDQVTLRKDTREERLELHLLHDANSSSFSTRVSTKRVQGTLGRDHVVECSLSLELDIEIKALFSPATFFCR